MSRNRELLQSIKDSGLYKCVRHYQAAGYRSNRKGISIEEYKGPYGCGYIIHYPSSDSKITHCVEYYVYK